MNDEYRGPEAGLGTDREDVELFADLGRFETGAIPVDATVRQGEAIRVRRRAFGGSALAVAAALSIGVPVAIAGGGNAGAGGKDGTYAASSSGGRVTVNPTSFTHGKGHFSGTVDGKKWSVDFDNKNCYYILWSCGFPDIYPWDKYASLTSTGSNPDDYVLFVNRDVARVEITLQDGEVLSLEPVPTVNVPVVLFALPVGLGVGRIGVFDSHDAEIAFSLPFNLKGAASAAAQWYKPGEKPPTDSGSVEIMRDDTRPGRPETISAFVGPSGPCIVTQSDDLPYAECNLSGPVTGSLSEQSPVVVSAGGAKSYGMTGDSGLVAPNIDRMQVDFADGTKSPISIKSLGGYHFYAYVVPAGKHMTGVTAFDATGKALPVQKNAQMTDAEQKWPSPATTR